MLSIIFSYELYILPFLIFASYEISELSLLVAFTVIDGPRKYLENVARYFDESKTIAGIISKNMYRKNL